MFQRTVGKGRGPPPTPLSRRVALAEDETTELEEFKRTRPDLEGQDETVVQRELLRTVLTATDAKEIAREDLLGPAFYGLKREQALDRLMDTLNNDYKRNFRRMYGHLQDSAFLAKVNSSTQMRRAIRPPAAHIYEPPPNHPDRLDGYLTTRRKHEAARQRLYGPSSGRVHVLPDGPANWNRRDGLRCGIADVQSFTNYMHMLQNAGFGAP